MFLRSGLGEPMSSAVTWKRKVTPSGRSWWVLGRSGRRTDETGCGSSEEWCTPRAVQTPDRPETIDARVAKQKAIYAQDKSRRWGKTESLHSQVAREWPTPSAMNPQEGESLETWLARREQIKAEKKNGNGMATPLAMAVRLQDWPRATAQDALGSGNRNLPGSNAHPGTSLTDAVLGGQAPRRPDCPTATSRDWKDGACADANVPTNGLLGRAVLRTDGKRLGRLNPAWVASLMGFPDGWL